jgi:hypothetical protein
MRFLNFTSHNSNTPSCYFIPQKGFGNFFKFAARLSAESGAALSPLGRKEHFKKINFEF